MLDLLKPALARASTRLIAMKALDAAASHPAAGDEAAMRPMGEIWSVVILSPSTSKARAPSKSPVRPAVSLAKKGGGRMVAEAVSHGNRAVAGA